MTGPDHGGDDAAEGAAPGGQDWQTAILSQLGEGVIVTDRDGRITFVNAAAERLHGVKDLQVAPDDYSATYHLFTEDGQPYPPLELPLARAVLRGETVLDARWRIRRPDGSEILAIGTARPLVIGGERRGGILTLRDDTERHQAEQALRASEERLQLVVDGARDHAIFTTDPERRITSWSAGAAAAFGLSADDAIGESADVIFTPDDRASGQPEREARIARETGCANDERWHLRADGSRVFMNGSVHPLPDDGLGRARGFIKIARDETERRAAEDALRESEARFRNVADHSPLMMWVTDATGYCTYLNRAWYDFTGQSEAQAEGFGWLDATHPDDKQKVEEEFLAANAAKRPFRVEYRLRRKDAAYRWAIDAAAPRFGADGTYLGYVGSVIDIDERREIEDALREREAHLTALVEQTAAGIAETDLAGRFVSVNDRYCAMVGRSRVELLGTRMHEITHPDDLAGNKALFDRMVETGAAFEIEKRYVRPDGTEIWVSNTVSLIRPGNGDDASTVLAISVDVTGRRVAEQALREESRTLETLNQTGAALAGELELERVVQLVTDAGVELTGAQFGAFFYNVAADGELMMLFALSGAERSDFEHFGMPRATAIFSPTFAGEGPIRSDDILTDPRYGKNHPHKGMPAGHLPVRSYLAVPVTSRSGEVIGGLFFGHPEPGRFSERHERLLVGIAAQTAVSMDNARLYQAAQTEVAERVAAEERLRELNETLETRIEERTRELDRVWNISQDLFVICGFDGVYRLVNPAWTEQLGHPRDALLGTRFDALVHPADVEGARREFERLIKGDVVRGFDARIRAADGSYRWYSWTCVPEQDVFYAAGRDVTERKQLEEQLRQAQKMETLGQLTGGVAHDFNNLLQIVTGNLEILRRNLPEDEARLRRSADNAMRGAERAAILTQRLLAFARRQPLDPKPLNLNKLVGGMSELLHRTIGETVEVETVLAAALWTVEADPNQLENAIINLAVNARDAMPDGGKLTIETMNTSLDHGYSAQHTGVLPGQYVVVCVSDTGTGMPVETLDRVFEPFFTTKDVGRGTGLGLSMVYGFVKQSGGHVKLYSEPGEGTTVKLYLPRRAGNVAEERDEAQPLAPEGTFDETILVCEDDDDVRAYSVEVLRELGYRVLEAHDGPSALRLLERQEGQVDLLFTDVVLPSGIMGNELAEQARAIRPELKVLFTTGYARNAIVHHGRLDSGVELITKPFSYADLAARIRDLLDRG